MPSFRRLAPPLQISGGSDAPAPPKPEGAPIDSTLPQWARVIMILGLPTFLVLVALGASLGVFNSPLMQIPVLVRDIEALRLELRAHAAETRETNAILRQICRAVSKSEVTAQGCER